MRKSAFSLIEVMVVIALLAILAMVAVPTYETYYAKAQVTKALDLMVQQLQRLHESRIANGTYPTSLSFLGTTYAQTGGGTLATNTFGGTHISFNSGTNFAYLQMYFSHTYLKLPVNASQSLGYALRTAILVDPTSGISRIICGPQVPGGDTNDLPVKYLPAICTCTNMANAWTGNPSGTGC